MNINDLLARTREYLPEDKVTLVKEAYSFAEAAHQGQVRKSGDPFISHPLDTAMTVAALQLDAAAVAAALLHDVQEDCGIPNADVLPPPLSRAKSPSGPGVSGRASNRARYRPTSSSTAVRA